MDFFADGRILFWGRRRECVAWVDKVFEGYYVLDFAETGSLLHGEGEEGLRRLEGPVAWLTYPGRRFRFGWPELDRRWHHRFVAFGGERARGYAESGLFPAERRPAVIAVADGSGFGGAFDELIDWLEENGPGEGRRGVHLLEGLLLRLHESGRGGEKGELGREVALGEAVAAVESNLERKWDFGEVAARLGLSYHHLRRIWKARTGLAPQDFLIDCRLKAAARRLRREGGSVKRIALECGFRDVPYFTRQFTRRFGMAPGRYREEATM